MVSHSLRPLPVKGEYRLPTNDLRIHEEIILGAADKIHAASLFVEPLLQPFDLTLDSPVLAVIKCIYLPPTYLHFIQDIDDRCLLLTSFTSFVDLPF
jgi:hypothetical protein